MTRYVSSFWLALALFSVLSAAFTLRYEVIAARGLNTTDEPQYVVWDRWRHRLCIAFVGREQLACTLAEIKSSSQAWRPLWSPSAVSIDEVRARLTIQARAGYIEKIERRDRILVVAGWAADKAAMSPVVAIHIFVADQPAAVGTPNQRRPDVATELSITSSNQFGFHIMVPIGSSSQGAIRAFAQLHDGSFGELEHFTVK